MKLPRPLLVWFASLTALLLAGSATAVTYDFEFDEVFAQGFGALAGFDGTFEVAGSITLPTNAPDLDNDPNSGAYGGITDFVLSANGLTLFDETNIDNGFVNVFDNGSFTQLGIAIRFDSTQLPEAAVLDAFTAKLSVQFFFDPALAGGDALPTELPEANKGELNFSAIGEILPKKVGIDGGGLTLGERAIKGGIEAAGEKGRITAIDENPIPEPTAAFLFAGGLLVTAHHLRRRR